MRTIRLLLTITSLACACSVYAADIDIDVQNFSRRSGIAKVVLKITNHKSAPIRSVFVDCAFLDAQKKAIDIGKALISNIDAGGHAYDTAAIVDGNKAEYVECRVSNFSQ